MYIALTLYKVYDKVKFTIQRLTEYIIFLNIHKYDQENHVKVRELFFYFPQIT